MRNMALSVRSSHCSMLFSALFDVGSFSLEELEDLGLMCMREAGLFSGAIPSCEKGFWLGVPGVCDGAGEVDWSFGVELVEGEGADAGVGRD